MKRKRRIWEKRKCVVCGKIVQRRRFRATIKRSTCGIVCRNTLIARTRTREDMLGPGNPNFKIGIKISQGYVYLYRPNHPHQRRGYIKKANLIVEKKLGRFLKKGEVIHHIDGNKLNDKPSNLKLYHTNSEHQKREAATHRSCRNKQQTIYFSRLSKREDMMKKSDYKICILEIVCHKGHEDIILKMLEEPASNNGLYTSALYARNLTQEEYEDFKANGPD